jgi:hypothetical protein
MSWNGEGTGESQFAQTVFSLVVRATQDIELSEVLSINSRYTVAEAYGTHSVLADLSPVRWPGLAEGEEVMDLGINFSKGEVAEAGAEARFELYQNIPNPFQAATLIGFNLPEDAAATVTINDASGHVLTIIKGDYAAGYNTLKVTKQDLQGATGVLSYTVTTDQHTATKQMIVVD